MDSDLDNRSILPLSTTPSAKVNKSHMRNGDADFAFQSALGKNRLQEEVYVARIARIVLYLTGVPRE